MTWWNLSNHIFLGSRVQKYLFEDFPDVYILKVSDYKNGKEVIFVEFKNICHSNLYIMSISVLIRLFCTSFRIIFQYVSNNFLKLFCGIVLARKININIRTVLYVVTSQLKHLQMATETHCMYSVICRFFFFKLPTFSNQWFFRRGNHFA